MAFRCCKTKLKTGRCSCWSLQIIGDLTTLNGDGWENLKLSSKEAWHLKD